MPEQSLHNAQHYHHKLQRILDAKEACVSFGIKALDHITTNRNVYDDADENGLSVFEVTSDPKGESRN